MTAPEIDPLLFAVLVTEWLEKWRRCGSVTDGKSCGHLASYAIVEAAGRTVRSLCDEHARDPIGLLGRAEAIPNAASALRAEQWLANFNSSRTA